MTIKADGTDKQIILHADYIGGAAWAPGSSPNYYIKHIEVAQAISPDLGPLNGFDDPLAEGERDITWTRPSVEGSTIPLVADKSTLLRIYVGDSNLEPGTTEERDVRFSVTGSTLSLPVKRKVHVKVTASDVAPTQTDAAAALNVWLPPQAAQSGIPVSLHVEINTMPDGAQDDPECDGCYPNGNKASLNGVRFEDGGNVIVAPLPIYVVAPDLTVTGPGGGWKDVWDLMTAMLPVGTRASAASPCPSSLPSTSTIFCPVRRSPSTRF